MKLDSLVLNQPTRLGFMGPGGELERIHIGSLIYLNPSIQKKSVKLRSLASKIQYNL